MGYVSKRTSRREGRKVEEDSLCSVRQRGGGGVDDEKELEEEEDDDDEWLISFPTGKRVRG